MVNTNTGLHSTRTVPTCPTCRRDLGFVCSWSYRGLWGYDEVDTYECPDHGPLFVKRQRAAGLVPIKSRDQGHRHRDRDSFVMAPRKPTPTPGTDTVAVPEPDSD
jgi:hypothetical protein